MFNRKASSSKSRASEVLNALKIEEGQKVADIGAGGGYFTLKFAEMVGPTGRVFAVDTDSELSDFVRDGAQERGLSNVETVISDSTLDLPRGGLDLIFMRNVTHHIQNRPEYFGNLKQFLDRNGRVAIIEYKNARRMSFRGVFGHFVSKDTLLDEMKQAGFTLKEDLDFLPEQSFTIYSPSAQ
jgi:ubiquinone/menaquinone biosynthesis C-methylase UbiE